MNRRLRGARPTPGRAALSVGLGALVGATPLVGLHAVIAMPLAALLRLDARLAFLGTNVSLPFLMPLLYGAELAVGSALHGAGGERPEGPAAIARAVALGTAVVAPLVALVAGGLAYGAADRLRRRRALRSARGASR